MKLLVVILFMFSSVLYSQTNYEYDVKPISENELNQIIANRSGKLLLINVWATWCVPCRKEFPALVKLSEKYSESLDVIAISVDYEDVVDKKVIPFLRKNNVEFPVFISGFAKDEEIINYFNKDWNGALPASIIYNSEGKKLEFLEGKHSFEGFSSRIEKFMSEF